MPIGRGAFDHIVGCFGYVSTANPTANPTAFWTAKPTANPTTAPTGLPAANPATKLTANLTANAAANPTAVSGHPMNKPIAPVIFTLMFVFITIVIYWAAEVSIDWSSTCPCSRFVPDIARILRPTTSYSYSFLCGTPLARSTRLPVFLSSSPVRSPRSPLLGHLIPPPLAELYY